MPCTTWHVFAAFDTTRSGWVATQQLDVGLRSLGLPTCNARLRELCVEAGSTDGFGFGGFCRVLGIQDIDTELDRAARWVGRQAHIWDIVDRANLAATHNSEGMSRKDVGVSMRPRLVPLEEDREEADKDGGAGTEEGHGDWQTLARAVQPLPERRQYCELVNSIAQRRKLTQGFLQALAARTEGATVVEQQAIAKIVEAPSNEIG